MFDQVGQARDDPGLLVGAVVDCDNGQVIAAFFGRLIHDRKQKILERIILGPQAEPADLLMLAVAGIHHAGGRGLFHPGMEHVIDHVFPVQAHCHKGLVITGRRA